MGFVTMERVKYMTVKEAKYELYKAIEILFDSKYSKATNDDEWEQYTLDVSAFYNGFESIMMENNFSPIDCLIYALEQIQTIKLFSEKEISNGNFL